MREARQGMETTYEIRLKKPWGGHVVLDTRADHEEALQVAVEWRESGVAARVVRKVPLGAVLPSTITYPTKMEEQE